MLRLLRLRVIESVFQELYRVLKDHAPLVFVVDLSRSPYLSSEAIGNLVGLYKRCLRLGHKLRVTGLSADLQELFSALHLDLLLPLFATLEEATAP